MKKKSFSAWAPPRTPRGEFSTLPQTPSRFGRGTPLPIPLPLGAYGASILTPSAFASAVFCWLTLQASIS